MSRLVCLYSGAVSGDTQDLSGGFTNPLAAGLIVRVLDSF
jgi:hypothetical protein